MKHELQFRVMSVIAILSLVVALILVHALDQVAAERDAAMESCPCQRSTPSKTSSNCMSIPFSSGIEPVPPPRCDNDSTPGTGR